MIFQRDLLFNVVCNIRVPLLNGQEEIGTGIFIGKGEKFYILTASHVIKNFNMNSYLILSGPNSYSTKVSFNMLSTNPRWEIHPIADLAYFEIILTQENSPIMQKRFFPYDHIDLNNSVPSRDLELTSIGFPLGLGIGNKYSPLTFRTFPSSGEITLNRSDNNKPCNFFITENPSIGGYSGGPIFDLGYSISIGMVQQKEKTVLYGIMHGTISDATGGKLGAITPTYYLNGWL